MKGWKIHISIIQSIYIKRANNIRMPIFNSEFNNELKTPFFEKKSDL